MRKHRKARRGTYWPRGSPPQSGQVRDFKSKKKATKSAGDNPAGQRSQYASRKELDS